MLEEMLMNIISGGNANMASTAPKKKTSPLFDALSLLGGEEGKYKFEWRGDIGDIVDGMRSGNLIRR